jgi:hypothetical protein
MLLFDQPQQFATAPAPDWATAWLAEREPPQSARTRSAPAQQRRDARRLENVRAGMRDLALWQHDLIRHGLAELPQKPKRLWFDMADRLVDAQAPAVARDVRQLALIVEKQTPWPGPLLRALGRLYLLTQAFERYDALPAAAQADLRVAVGWLPAPGEGDESVDDEWLIIGRTTDAITRRTIQHIWLWGLTHNRPALLRQVATGKRQINTSLLVGTVRRATLRFYAGQQPLMAAIEQTESAETPTRFVAGYPTIDSAMGDYAAALARNPWLRRFPLALSAAGIVRYAERWFIVDAAGTALPVAPNWLYGWHLLAMTDGRQLPLFAIWDGAALTPLSVWYDDRLLPFSTLEGVA